MPLYDDRFRKLIATHMACGASTREIVDALNWTVNNYRRNIDALGVPVPPPASNPHRPKKIHLAAEEEKASYKRHFMDCLFDESRD